MTALAIKTTHVGSLIRPASLRDDLGGADSTTTPLAERLSRAVTDVVARQVEIGIDIVNDGEMSKSGWIHYVYDRVSGVEPRTLVLTEDDLAAALPRSVDRESLRGAEGRFTNFWSERLEPGEEATVWTCVGQLTYDAAGAAVEADIRNLRLACDRAGATTGFINAVAPGSLHWLANEHYATEEEFMFAWADVLRTEYQRVIEAGFLLQVDDAVMWHKFGTMRLQGASVHDYARWASLRVEALNHALAGIPIERVRYHVCSGSQPGPHTHDPSLADVLEFVLKVNAGCLLIEQANARHEHEWEVWRRVKLPDDRCLAPGVVTHHTLMVEHPELVAERLVRIARIVGPERVIASTDCGFAQHAVRQRVPLWTQWAKLATLVEGARLASRRLSGLRGAA